MMPSVWYLRLSFFFTATGRVVTRFGLAGTRATLSNPPDTSDDVVNVTLVPSAATVPGAQVLPKAGRLSHDPFCAGSQGPVIRQMATTGVPIVLPATLRVRLPVLAPSG